MKGVTAIPLLEVTLHFLRNKRQDAKIIAPEIMSEELFQRLSSRKKDLKPEVPVEGNWTHSAPDLPNGLYLSADFNYASLAHENLGPLAVSFANEWAEQDAHYHKQHVEMYYSEHPFRADCRLLEDPQVEQVQLAGGALILGPDVIHKVSLTGMTIIVEFPAVKGDRVPSQL
jgi:hypothetical protein